MAVIKKAPRLKAGPFLLLSKLSGNRAYGAGACAGAAVYALGGVNNSFAVGFGYGGHGAGRLARAAVNAGFSIDFICHCKISLYNIVNLL